VLAAEEQDVPVWARRGLRPDSPWRGSHLTRCLPRRSGERLRAPCVGVYDVERAAYAIGMWDVLTWHDGTLAIAWWAVIVLIVALLSIGGTAAARRR
jgi:hypothetical protein